MLTLRRITAGDSFIPQIDGLRFVAILSVVLFHLHASLAHNGAVASPLAGSQDALQMLSKRGVELFFAISGFILAKPFAKERLYGGKAVRLRDYFLRRITRLEPPYVFSLVVCAAAYAIARPERLADVRADFLPTLLYLHQALYGSTSLINGVTWSLEVEVQFYVLAPLLTAVFFIHRDWLRRGVLAGSLAAWSVWSLRLADTPAMLTIAYYLPFFLAGMLVCDLYLEQDGGGKSLAWDVAGLAAWPLVWSLGPQWGHVVLPFAIVALHLSVFRGRVSAYLFSRAWITNIGGMCYTIYLFHFLLISSIGVITKRLYFGGGFGGYFLLQAALILPAILGFCGLCFLCIERPCMDKRWPQQLAAWVRRIAKSISASRGTAAAALARGGRV